MYLRRLAERHGNDWPTAALDRLLWLHSARAWACQDLADEYLAPRFRGGRPCSPGRAKPPLSRGQAIEAGIAFQQHAEQ